MRLEVVISAEPKIPPDPPFAKWGEKKVPLL